MMNRTHSFNGPEPMKFQGFQPVKREGTFASLNVKEEEKIADLEVWDFIGDEWYGTTAKDMIAQIKDLPESIETINVLISSPGGYVWDAIEMYQALKNHPANVVTEVNSIAASAATIVFMAGDERKMGPHADFMIHKPWTCLCGDADKFQEGIDQLNRDQAKLVGIYAEGTDQDEKTLNELVNATTWMSAEEALDLGFATQVNEEIKAAACLFDLSQLNGVPEHHTRLAKAHAKRQKEQAERDAGKSSKEAKKAVSSAVERDANNDGYESNNNDWQAVLTKVKQTEI